VGEAADPAHGVIAIAGGDPAAERAAPPGVLCLGIKYTVPRTHYLVYLVNWHRNS
jgi:hypothetical protein